MKTKEGEAMLEYIVEREFLGKITAEEFVENIIKKHCDENGNSNEM